MNPLLILGASARAAASSASRAGFDPIAVDLFADRDLAARFPSHRVDRDAYPAALAEIAAGLPHAPWIYTGALENHPDLVDRIARARPLLGIAGDALRAVRDPRRWTKALHRASLPALDVLVEGDDPPGRGRWLLKPRASAMGTGLRRWTIGAGPIPSGRFLQALAPGEPMAACFLGEAGSARLVAVTRQLLGRNEHRLRARYRGSAGPVALGPRPTAAIARIGEALADAFGLRGLFGVDLLMDGGTPHAVEINPRYTASVEVLEEGLGVSLVAEHARAFGAEAPGDAAGMTLGGTRKGMGGCLGSSGASPQRASASAGGSLRSTPGTPAFGVIGPPKESRALGTTAKAILRARRPAIVPEAWPWSDPLDPSPIVADLPAAGTILRPGDPVLTVLARGGEVAHLRDAVALWRRRIDAWPAP